MFDFAGGESAFLQLAAAHHERCLADPVLNHPFSHGVHPEHVERLASYWAEVFGGAAVVYRAVRWALGDDYYPCGNRGGR